MNNLFIISVIILFACGSFGQEQTLDHFKLVEDSVLNPAEIQSEHLYKAGLGDKRLDSTVSFSYTSELDSIRNIKHEYFYNIDDRIITRNRYTWQRKSGFGVEGEGTWIGKEKYEYEYSEQGEKIWFKESFTYPMESNWVWAECRTKYEYRWSKEGRLEYFYIYIKDDNADEWYLDWKKVFKYTDFGQLDSYETLRWNQNQWTGHSTDLLYVADFPSTDIDIGAAMGGIVGGMGTYEYDNTGNLTSRTNYRWDLLDNKWKVSSKYDMKYDLVGNMTLQTDYNWDSDLNEWLGSSKIEFTFNEDSNQTLFVSYEWDSEFNEWIRDWKHEYVYDEDGNQSFELIYIWDSEQNEWINSNKYEFSNDEAGNRILFALYDWDTELNNWIGDWKNEYAYDEDGNQTFCISYSWDSDLKDWVGDSKTEDEFDESGNQTSYASYSWDSDLKDWVIDYKGIYFYSTSSGIKYLSDESIAIYPNPTSGIINITGLIQPANIKIYNLQGQLLKSYNQVINTIDLTDLNKGVYILNLRVGENEIVKKIVKE